MHNAPKMLSETHFYRCWLPRRGLGTSKIMEILRTVCKFGVFASLNSCRLLSSTCKPHGLLSGSLLALKMAETSLGIPRGAAKSRSRDLLFDPGAFQECSKRPPGALQEASRSAPRGLQAAIRQAFWHHVEPSGTYCGFIWGSQNQ